MEEITVSELLSLLKAEKQDLNLYKGARCIEHVNSTQVDRRCKKPAQWVVIGSGYSWAVCQRHVYRALRNGRRVQPTGKLVVLELEKDQMLSVAEIFKATGTTPQFLSDRDR